MANGTIATDRIWADFLSLSRPSRARFLARLVADEGVRQEIEALLDLALVNERHHEPTRPLDDVLVGLGE